MYCYFKYFLKKKYLLRTRIYLVLLAATNYQIQRRTTSMPLHAHLQAVWSSRANHSRTTYAHDENSSVRFALSLSQLNAHRGRVYNPVYVSFPRPPRRVHRDAAERNLNLRSLSLLRGTAAFRQYHGDHLSPTPVLLLLTCVLPVNSLDRYLSPFGLLIEFGIAYSYDYDYYSIITPILVILDLTTVVYLGVVRGG